MAKFKSDKNFTCDRCQRNVPAYYTKSDLVKGLVAQCPSCGTHFRSYVPGLDLPYKPSKSYLKSHPELKEQSKGTRGLDYKQEPLW